MQIIIIIIIIIITIIILRKVRDAVPVETHKLALAHHRVSSSSSG